jgi:long-chain acyl-CoA synthetase
LESGIKKFFTALNISVKLLTKSIHGIKFGFQDIDYIYTLEDGTMKKISKKTPKKALKKAVAKKKPKVKTPKKAERKRIPERTPVSVPTDLLSRRPWIKYYDYLVPPEINFPKFYAPQILFHTASLVPEKAALWFYGTETSFWDLYITVNRLANALIKIGVKKGDRVGILLPNSPQFVIAFWAILTAGGIVTNMNPLYTPDELKFIAQNTGMTCLITFERMVPTIKELTKQVKMPRVIVGAITDFIKDMPMSTPESLGLEKEWHHFSGLIDGCNNEVRPRLAISVDDPAVLQFTGGTTGVPKGAILSHANIVAAMYEVFIWGNNVNAEIPVESRTSFSVLPYFHVYGEVCQMGWSIFCGATQIILPRFELDEVFDTLSKFKEITYFAAVPTMLTAIFNHPKAKELNLAKKIRLVTNGGAPCPLKLIEKLQDMHIRFSEGWGMSETTSLGVSSPVMGMQKPLSIGVPICNVDVRIVDIVTGKDVPQGTPGEILIKSPYVMKGYWNNPEETAKQMTDGWLRTGDVAYMDEDYYIFIVDRTKDMIIAGGYNIYPQEIDQILLDHPKVADAICVGIPDEYRGETLKAFIVLKPGMTTTEQDIIAFCKAKLAAYKVPKQIEFRASLPRSVVGKAFRRILRDEELAKKKSK